MRRPALLVALLALLPALAGCGHHASSERITREWSAALNSGDNDAAAKFFAKNASVIQAGFVTHFHSLADATKWNSELPCSGFIESIETDGDTTTATFLLGARRGVTCDAPGATATAQFTVRHGKIVLFRQLADVGPPTV